MMTCEMEPNNIEFPFSVVIHFNPCSGEPERVFKAAYSFIVSLQEIDSLLLSSIPLQIKSSCTIDSVESSSLKANFKLILESIDDDALKAMDWKILVGKYIVQAKYYLISRLEDDNRKEFDFQKIIDHLYTLVQKTKMLSIPSYRHVNQKKLAKCISSIGYSFVDLHDDEYIEYHSDDKKIRLNKTSSFSQEDIENMLTRNLIENDIDLILIVKKPDLLGDSMWSFKLKNTTYSASINDYNWIKKFRNGEIDMRPHDSLKVTSHEIYRYDANGELLSQKNVIKKVHEVIKPQRRESNPLPETE